LALLCRSTTTLERPPGLYGGQKLVPELLKIDLRQFGSLLLKNSLKKKNSMDLIKNSTTQKRLEAYNVHVFGNFLKQFSDRSAKVLFSVAVTEENKLEVAMANVTIDQLKDLLQQMNKEFETMKKE